MPSNTLPHHGRYDYSPITERKDYSWPGGKRLAFCITTNIECFAFNKGRGHDNAKHGEPQTQRNYSWRDYGNRMGVWRLFDFADELDIPLAHNMNSMLYDFAPQIFERIRRRGDEIIAHGRVNWKCRPGKLRISATRRGPESFRGAKQVDQPPGRSAPRGN